MKFRLVHTKGAAPLPIGDFGLDSAWVSVCGTQVTVRKCALAQYWCQRMPTIRGKILITHLCL